MLWRTRSSTRERVNTTRSAQAASDSGKPQRSWQHSLDIGSRLAKRLATHGIDRLTREADRLFRESCSDPLLTEYIVSLPLGALPEIRGALSARTSQNGQERLADVVRAAIARDWPQLSPRQIEDATDLYLCSLGWARPPRRVALLAPVALRKVSDYAC